MKGLTKRMKIFGLACLAGALVLSGAGADLQADGCYICSGQSNTYVKFTGNDDGAKRAAAKNCGCTVAGTTSSCNAANYKILCTVLKEKDQQAQIAVFPMCVKPGT